MLYAKDGRFSMRGINGNMTRTLRGRSRHQRTRRAWATKIRPLTTLAAFLVLTTGCNAPSAANQQTSGRDSARSDRAASIDEAAALRDRPVVASFRGPWVCSDSALSPAYEPTVFVAPNGSDSNDGSEQRPLATLQEAADRVAPGDVVWLRDGVYSSDVVFETSGREGSPIVVESYPGECAILDGSSVGSDERISLEGVTHMVLRNLVIRNSPREGIYMKDSSDNVLSNLRLHDNYYSGITTLGGDRNLFTYIVSHDNADSRGGDADGISISSGDRNHVAYCVAHSNSDDGVDTWRATNTLVERCIAFRNGEASGDGNGFKAGGDPPSANTVVRYSIAFENRSNGFDYNGGRDVVFDHDTSFDNGGYGFVATGATLRANLAVANEKGAWYGEVAGGASSENSWQVGAGASALAAHDSGAADFLSLTSDGSELGALGPGETILEAFGVELASFLNP